MRVCVATIVQHPEHARITHRQIRALREAAHDVTFIAPFRHCNASPPPGVRAIDVPRAVGTLSRIKAIKAARAALRQGVRDADLLLIHDLELLLALPGKRPPTVWDVHEDLGAEYATVERSRLIRRLAPAVIRRLERRAEQRLHLILADESHRSRFTGDHPIVPDHAYVPQEVPPPSDDHRIVYLGRISAAHGAVEMIELARRLKPYGIRLDLIGEADARTRPLLQEAQRTGLLDWFGHVPYPHALRMAEGALAGLCLLRDLPLFHAPVPVKVIDYMACGLPVITTALPGPAALVERLGCGTVVPFGEPAAVAEAAARAVLRLRDDPSLRAAMGARGHAEALLHRHWPEHAGEFVALLERWAGAEERSAAVPR
ncbi:glycosyltransferase [Thermobispora bispora]|uniref:glycosyltransferase n=1 Tax=Thermobispora bispora TaxID=2006 RepID=UPI0019821B30|nr:glycosyltransferase [Thermobispora bispora]QSI47392.1 glycosyltransferase [Thermobispora bispora]